MTEIPATARERLRARAARVRTIRRRVAAIALATFVLAFGVIASTGSMGVSANATTTSTTVATPTPTAAPSSSPSADSGASGGEAVTTRQS